MLVVEVDKFGGPEVLQARQVPDLEAGPGEAVLRVAAADVMSVDTVIRSGQAKGYFPVRPPYIPGNGVAGSVIATGPGVDPAWQGRAVVAHTGGPGGSGGYAEQAAVQAGDLIPVPDGLALAEAAALLHDGATAVGLLERVGVRPGEWVLITAAAGGMGVLLIQLARLAGGRVIAAARGQRKLAVARQAGAGAVLDYSVSGWPDRVRSLTGGQGADVIFDGAGGKLGGAAFEVTATGGRFSAHGMLDGGFAAIDPATAQARGITVHGIGEYDPAGFRRQAAAALADAAAGRIRPVIGQTFPLARAAAAHAAIAARSTVAKSLLLT
jgi:NADPH2:quinone reductase